MSSPEAEEAFDKVCRFLTYRPRTEHEITLYLERKGYSGVREAVVDRLKRAGLIDDRAFAESWIAERAGARGYGARRIRSELFRLGVDKSLVEDTMEDAYPEEREADRIMAIAERQWPKIAGKTPFERGRKLYSYLARRGFSGTLASDAVESLIRLDKDG